MNKILQAKRLKSRFLVAFFACFLPSLLFTHLTLAQTTTFNYTGATQTFTVPACVTSINYTVNGARGGGAFGGNGARVVGTLAVTPGQVLQINVGGQGASPAGGWNGGGNGINITNASGGGGGASDIRVTPYALAQRVVVAAGGGGHGYSLVYAAPGGTGGCATGTTGVAGYGLGGTGGTQIAGGIGGLAFFPPGTNGTNGGLGVGGTGGTDNCTSRSHGGGGGGGYFGGGGGGADCFTDPFDAAGGGGGGGSCLTPIGATCTPGINTGNGSVIITILAAPNATFTSVSSTICNGTQFTLTGNITATGAWTLTLSNGQTATGTGNGTWSIVVIPTATTTYSFTSLVDAVRCSTPTGNRTLTLPIAGTTLSANNESATCPVNQNGWINFYHSSGRMIASVNSLGQNLGNVTVTSYVDAVSQLMPACLAPTNPLYNTNVMLRHWVITPTIQPATPVQVRFPFSNAELLNLITVAGSNVNLTDDVSSILNLKLSKYSGPSNVDNLAGNNCPSAGGSGGTTIHTQILNGTTLAYSAVTGASFTNYSIPSFSEFWLHGSSINSPLPITLLSFETICEDVETQLKWSTSSQQNSSHFEVERSDDAETWKKIGTINAAGNSTQVLHYGFDDNGFRGQSLLYYRLKMVDLDGTLSYSDIRSVNCNDNSPTIRLVPNPAKEQATLLFSKDRKEGDVQIFIKDINGRTVQDTYHHISNNLSLDLDLKEIQPGCYFVVLQQNGTLEKTIRLIKN